MADKVHIQRLRGNTAQNNNYTGIDGEMVINTDSHSIRIHDGSKQGGHGTVYAASSATEVYAAINDLAEGAVVIVGTEAPYKLMQKINGVLVEKAVSANGDVYAAHTANAEETEELKEIMPDGGVVIERDQNEEHPVLKQLVNGEFQETILKSSTQVTYTADEEETNAIIGEVDEGAIIVEGPGAIVVETDAKVSEEAGNVIEKKEDGIYAAAFDDSNVVHKTGEEHVFGLKVFRGGINYDSKYWLNLQNSELDQAAEESGKYGFVLNVTDSKGVGNATIFSSVNKNGSELLLRAGLNGTKAVLSVKDVKGGDAVANAPTPPANSNTNHIATTEWVRTNIDANVVHKTGNEIIAGNKTYTGQHLVQGDTPGVTFVDTVANPTGEMTKDAWAYLGLHRDAENKFTLGHCTNIYKADHSLSTTGITSYIYDKDTGERKVYGSIEVLSKADGTTVGRAPTPPADSNTNEIATTAWVRSNFLATQLNVTVTGYDTGVATFNEYFRYSKYGRMVVVDFGGLRPVKVGNSQLLCVNGKTNLPIMRSRAVINLYDDFCAANKVVCLYGATGTNAIYMHAPNSVSVGQTHFGQMIYFTD